MKPCKITGCTEPRCANRSGFCREHYNEYQARMNRQRRTREALTAAHVLDGEPLTDARDLSERKHGVVYPSVTANRARIVALMINRLLLFDTYTSYDYSIRRCEFEAYTLTYKQEFFFVGSCEEVIAFVFGLEKSAA